ncbi:STAS domain-containing protein [Thiorhodovibrio frisius]|nr:STAS domain-containing protein [Thiorhodovibrio frisius]
MPDSPRRSRIVMPYSKPLDQTASDRPMIPPSASQVFGRASAQIRATLPRQRSAVSCRLRSRANAKLDQALQEAVWVQADSSLDIASLDMMQEAIHAARFDQHQTGCVVIDMKNTRRVFDSGLELLLFLYRKAGKLRDNLHIVNAGAGVRKRLNEKGLDACFHLHISSLN